MRLTRRQFLASATALPLASAGLARAFADAAPAQVSLGDAAEKSGILFGTAYDEEVLSSPVLADLYVAQSRVFTSDNFLKFGSLRPNSETADFSVADRLIDFALSRKIKVRGHNLIWNDWAPDWLKKSSPKQITYWLDRHIDETVSRYAGKLHSWDVVNEPFWPPHGNPGGYRGGPWFTALGKDYVARAYKRAAAADPSVKLVLNESGPEWQRYWNIEGAPVRRALLQLIGELQDAGVRLDAIGLQCHWMADFEFSAAAFSDFLHEIAGRKLAIYITELDVSDAKLTGSEAERDAEVARRYSLLLSTALKLPEVEVVQTWQLSDAVTWQRAKPFQGPGGRLPRPLPFDTAMQPKPAAAALAKAFAGRSA